MIFYFSGTGNSKWIAKKLAQQLEDEAINIAKIDNIPLIKENDILGIVFPVYAWSPPEIVIKFVKKLSAKASFTFAVCTCGAQAGNSFKNLEKHIHVDSCYSITMPNNYIMGSDVDSEDVIRHKISDAKLKINKIAVQVKKKEPVFDVNVGKLAVVKSSLVSVLFNKFARSTKPFMVTDKCIGCCKCADNCPSKTITMIDGKPKWGEQCYQCTACINMCPARAIEYGKSTENRGRYQFHEN